MSNTTVKYLNSSMSGAPSLDNTAGSLISLLDACLIDGFGSVTLDSLVVASNVATATVSGGHQFAMIGDTGPVITIAGANPSGLNGQWRITVTGSAEFTFATTGIGDQTATGTITAKRSPAGFSKAFSGTNKAAYRSDDVTGTRLYLRVDDDYTTYSRLRGYETMSDVDTGTGPFPTDAQQSGGGYLYKATNASRAWTLFSDGRVVYFFCDASGSATWAGGFTFGDIDSYVASDAYGSHLTYVTSSSGSLPGIGYLDATTGSVLARAYTQVGGSITSARYSHGKSTYLGYTGEAYPAVADNSLHLSAIEVWNTTATSRGMMPGLWNPLHNSGLSHGLSIDNIPQLPGRTLLIQKMASSYYAAIDLTGPWR